ncbi:Protein mlo2 [Lachnellula subtilissima]|uniref:Protein mlo2 n=1 Tax=Lachnellula subtilissima TaxID=602034 RepID=A0A8H8RW31_9HELO|nr:Protein mlo2 [Lachnellula subtilissima]
MDPPPVPDSSFTEQLSSQATAPSRSQSFSQKSDESHTAAEFIDSQLQLEADAREALPYKFDDCTKTLGPLRQVLFSCLTCNPPPENPSDPYKPAGVCYSCSIQCHGEHTLVELFNKRNFTCDCGTTRLPATSPCTLRINPETTTKGGAHSELPDPNNKYNQNFKNRFCGCECDYDAHAQKGTMFQCLGLGTADEGGCGEDWWHPGCIVGMGPEWFEQMNRTTTPRKPKNEGLLESITEVAEDVVEGHNGEDANITGNPTETAPEEDDDDPPPPPGFPEEDDFDGFICYKCVDANPWIKRYADTKGFLGPVFKRSTAPSPERGLLGKVEEAVSSNILSSKKRKADDDDESETSGPPKRLKDESSDAAAKTTSKETSEALDKPAIETSPCRYKALLPAPTGQFSLFFKSDFRDHLCHCSDCFPNLKKHNQLLEEEEIYEPEMSESGGEDAASTVGSGSIYDRGESALKNVDRVKAIEGVMAYNHLKDQLTPFFKQFAESGKAIGAEDIKAHFAKMRGDADAIKAAGEDAKSTDNRKEQSGY